MSIICPGVLECLGTKSKPYTYGYLTEIKGALAHLLVLGKVEFTVI